MKSSEELRQLKKLKAELEAQLQEGNEEKQGAPQIHHKSKQDDCRSGYTTSNPQGNQSIQALASITPLIQLKTGYSGDYLVSYPVGRRKMISTANKITLDLSTWHTIQILLEPLSRDWPEVVTETSDGH